MHIPIPRSGVGLSSPASLTDANAVVSSAHQQGSRNPTNLDGKLAVHEKHGGQRVRQLKYFMVLKNGESDQTGM